MTGLAAQLGAKLEDALRWVDMLAPLIGDGREEFQFFHEQLRQCLEAVRPTATIAICGPLNSGKSTLFSALIRENPANSLVPVGASNETFTSLAVKRGERRLLVTKFFSVDVLEGIQRHLGELERDGGAATHEIAAYRDIQKKLKALQEVAAGEEGRGVVAIHDLDGLKRQDAIKLVHAHVSQSPGASTSSPVFGVYDVSLTLPDIPEALEGIRLIDLYGFGEPNPLVGLKFSKLVSSYRFDALVYVLPDRAISDHIYKLFQLPNIEQLFEEGRVIFVLNKADAYTDKGPGAWSQVPAEFVETLARNIPFLRRFKQNLVVRVMSAAAIEHPESLRRSPIDATAIQQQSREAIRRLRDDIKSFAQQPTDPLLELGRLMELLDFPVTLVSDVQAKLSSIADLAPRLDSVISRITSDHAAFEVRTDARLEALRLDVEERLRASLMGLADRFEIDTATVPPNDPAKRFAWCMRTANEVARNVYNRQIASWFRRELLPHLDSRLRDAFWVYVEAQDSYVQGQQAEILGSVGYAVRPYQPMSTTVLYGLNDVRGMATSANFALATDSVLGRYCTWYFRTRCSWDVGRGEGAGEIVDQVRLFAEEALRSFALFYFCEAPPYEGLRSQICVGGEPTFWQRVRDHVSSLTVRLGEQVELQTWKLGIFRNKGYFVSNSPKYTQAVRDLNTSVDAIYEILGQLMDKFPATK